MEPEPEETAVAPVDLAGSAATADIPEDLDDAMGWLEELAAKQGAPLEELPTIAAVVDETLDAPVELEPDAAMPELTLPPESVPEQAAPAPDLAEALDWLEQLAHEEGADLGAVTVGETAVPTAENELAAALDWLEKTAQSDEAPAVSPVAGTPPGAQDDLVDLTDEMPDDPDEALAWLQQWAINEEVGEVVGVPAAEEPETAAAPPTEPDDELDSAPPTETALDLSDAAIEEEMLSEIPDDPDAAMAWLEQLAARQGAPLEELPSVTAVDEPTAAIEPPAVPETDAAPEPEPEDAVETAADLTSALAADLPVADDAASWLDELVEADGHPLDDIPVIAETLAPEPAAAEAPGPTDLDVPEDMDDAMAWLEELAAQQGAALEELPSLSDKPDTQPEPPPAAETAVEPDVEPEEPEADIPVSKVETVPVADEVDDEDFDPEPVEDLDGAMPDWLDLDSEQSDMGQTEWLTSLDEPDVVGWLEAEEDASLSSSIYDRSVASRFDPQPDVLFDTGPLSPPAGSGLDTGPLTLPEEEVVTSVLDLDEAELAKARQAVAEGAFDEALPAYQELVDAGSGLMTLLADLESAADTYPEQPSFRHLLGDAYMRNGQLQKALDTYRMALDQL